MVLEFYFLFNTNFYWKSIQKHSQKLETPAVAVSRSQDDASGSFWLQQTTKTNRMRRRSKFLKKGKYVKAKNASNRKPSKQPSQTKKDTSSVPPFTTKHTTQEPKIKNKESFSDKVAKFLQYSLSEYDFQKRTEEDQNNIDEVKNSTEELKKSTEELKISTEELKKSTEELRKSTEELKVSTADLQKRVQILFYRRMERELDDSLYDILYLFTAIIEAALSFSQKTNTDHHFSYYSQEKIIGFQNQPAGRCCLFPGIERYTQYPGTGRYAHPARSIQQSPEYPHHPCHGQGKPQGYPG